MVPGVGTTVQILEPVTVTLNTGETISGLLIVTGATLEIVAGGSLTIAGNLSNAGTIILDDPPLTYSGTVSLTGGGQIQMIGSSSANVISGTPGTTLTNVDNTIIGSADIGTADGSLTFINKGTVDATPLAAGDSGLIVINTGNQVTNSGTFEATGGGTLTIDDPLSNSGTLAANGGTLDVTHAVTGSGSASVSGGGTFEIGSTDAEAFAFLGNGTLKLDAGSDFTGNITLAAGAIIDLAGTAVASLDIEGSTLVINGEPATFTVSGIPAGDTVAFKSDGSAGTDLVVLPQVLTIAASPVSGIQGSAIALNVQETLSNGAALTSLTLGDISSGAALTNSNGDALIVTNGSITFDAAQIAAGDLNGLSITLANAQTFSLSVLATATDSNGYEYAVPATESVTVNSGGPTLTVASGALVVNEEGSVALGIGETPANPNDTVTVTITGLPADATLSDSLGATLAIVNNSITLTAAELAGLTLHAGDTSGTLDVTATETINGNTATSAAKTIDVTVEPVAPTLTVASGALVVNEEGSVALGISETPADPSDTVTIKITGLPADATLSDSLGATLTIVNNSITLTAAELAGLTLHAGDTSAELSVTAATTINGNTATSAAKTIDVTVEPVAPTLTVPSGALVVNEEGSVALGISETPADPNDTVTIKITGLPADATLSDSLGATLTIVNNSITLTAAELAGLTLHAGDTSAELSVTAATTINGNTATSAAKTIDVTVEPVAPTLTVPSGALVVNEEGSVALGIGETPADPNDTVTIKITGLPADATLSDSLGATLTIVNNSITLTAAELAGLTLHAGDTSGTLDVTATETINGNTATSAAKTIDVTVEPAADTWQGPANGTWSTDGNWSFNSPPSAGEAAVINSGGTPDVTSSTSVDDVTLQNAGTITVPSGVTLTFDDGTTVSGGTVVLDTGGTLTLDNVTLDSGAVNFAGAGTLHLEGAIAGLVLATSTGSAAINVTAIADVTLTAPVTDGIDAISSGTGGISLTTSAGDLIEADASGLVAVNTDTTIGTGAHSIISVTAAGTIYSGMALTDGYAPAGILAGYNGTGAAEPGVNGTVTVDNSANILAAAGDGISAFNFGNGNVTVNDEANTAIQTTGVNGEFGIDAFSEGVGDVSVTTSTGDVIYASSAAIAAENLATSIPDGAESAITVTAYGTIYSGPNDTPYGNAPAGILAGYNSSDAAETGVNGTVTVDNFANIYALAGDGISAFNFGNGNVTVNDEANTTIATTGPEGLYGIEAFSWGSGNITVAMAAGDIVNSASVGVVAVSAGTSEF